MVRSLISATEASGMTMTQFLSTGTEVAKWLFDQAGTVSGVVMSNPMIAVPFYIFVAGAAIGFFGRLIHI